MKQELILTQCQPEMIQVALELGINHALIEDLSQVEQRIIEGPGGVIVVHQEEQISPLTSLLNNSNYACLLVNGEALSEEPSLLHFEQSTPDNLSQSVRRVRSLLERIWAKSQLGSLKDSIEQTDLAHKNSQAVLEQLQSQLRADRDVANKEVLTKTAVLNLLAHEVRTPINGIMGMVQWFSESPLNDEQQTYIEALEKSGNSILEMVNSLLDWGKLEDGQVEPNNHPVQFNSLIQDLQRLFSPMAQAKGLKLSINSNLPLNQPVSLDETKFRQILTNLISNAVKYTEQGEVSADFNLNTLSQQMTVTITDSGLGVEAEKIPHLFTPFWQVEEWGSKNNQGSGLGLAIVQRLVGILGGEICVTSQLGEGTAFTLTVPVNSTRPETAPTLENANTYLQGLQTHLMTSANDEALDLLDRFTSSIQGLRLHGLNGLINDLRAAIGTCSSTESLCLFNLLRQIFFSEYKRTKSGAA